jgi:hypothetical protein
LARSGRLPSVGGVIWSLRVAPVESDDADHRPVEVDHEKTPGTGWLRLAPWLEFGTRPGPTRVGVYLGRGEQIDALLNGRD